MAKISECISILLLFRTIIHGLSPCSDYYIYAVKPGTNDEIMKKIEIPFPPESSEHDLKVGFNANPSVHKI